MLDARCEFGRLQQMQSPCHFRASRMGVVQPRIWHEMEVTMGLVQRRLDGDKQGAMGTAPECSCSWQPLALQGSRVLPKEII